MAVTNMGVPETPEVIVKGLKYLHFYKDRGNDSKSLWRILIIIMWFISRLCEVTKHLQLCIRPPNSPSWHLTPILLRLSNLTNAFKNWTFGQESATSSSLLHALSAEITQRGMDSYFQMAFVRDWLLAPLQVGPHSMAAGVQEQIFQETESGNYPSVKACTQNWYSVTSTTFYLVKQSQESSRARGISSTSWREERQRILRPCF